MELAYFYNVATGFFLRFDILHKLYLTEVLVLKYFSHYTLPVIVLDDEFCVRFSVFSSLLSFPIKMHATDVKMQKIKPDPIFFYDGQIFLRQCVNVIEKTGGRIYFLMCENLRLSVQSP